MQHPLGTPHGLAAGLDPRGADLFPPDIHIFTASKQPWVVLPPGTPAVDEYYDRKQYWPADSLARRDAVFAKLESK